MDQEEFDKFNKWLGISTQQFEVLISLHNLEVAGTETKPKKILDEYTRAYGKKIKPPNLFGILKSLIKLRIVTKLGKGTYMVNPSSIKEIIETRKKEFEVELKNFNSVSSDIGEFFRRGSVKNIKPYVEYIKGRKAFWDFINPKLKEVKKYYIVAGFPGISFTEEVSSDGADRGEYLNIIKNRCFVKKELQIVYLSPLSAEILRTYVKLKFDNEQDIILECKKIIDTLKNQISENELLSVNYYKNPFGLDVIIPLKDDPEEMFMFVRDENLVQIGGIYIRSPEATKNAIDRFNEVCSHAIRLKNDATGKKVFRQLRLKLGTTHAKKEKTEN